MLMCISKVSNQEMIISVKFLERNYRNGNLSADSETESNSGAFTKKKSYVTGIEACLI